MIRLTLLALSMFFAAQCAHGQTNPIKSVEGPFVPSVTCPPDSVYHWKKVREPAKVVLWAIPTDDWSVIGPYIAVTSQVGTVAIIYARTSITQASSYLFNHESCHALGWTHEETRGIAPEGIGSNGEPK